MKNNLFEILLHLFEKSLTQLKEIHKKALPLSSSLFAKEVTDNLQEEEDDDDDLEHETIMVKSPRPTSLRIFAEEEQTKLTKASYTLLHRLQRYGIIKPEVLEIIIHQLTLSESRFVTIKETQWAIRHFLADNLEPAQLAFLDFILCQKEEKIGLN